MCIRIITACAICCTFIACETIEIAAKKKNYKYQSLLQGGQNELSFPSS